MRIARRIVVDDEAKATGLAWKHSSESVEDLGHSRYWYPPPWFTTVPNEASTVLPAGQYVTLPAGSTDPALPFLKPDTDDPKLSVPATNPDAMLQASRGFACPGARQGKKRVQSPACDILSAFQVRNGRSLLVGSVGASHPSALVPPYLANVGYISLPLPAQVQPMRQPTWNQYSGSGCRGVGLVIVACASVCATSQSIPSVSPAYAVTLRIELAPWIHDPRPGGLGGS